MRKEFLRDIGQVTVDRASRLPSSIMYGLAISFCLVFGGGYEIYSGVRSSIDRKYRESQLEIEALERTRCAVRDAKLDAMSNNEMAEYARNDARKLRFLVLPAMAEGERRDN